MVDLPLARFGKYVVLETLGQGGAGRVDLALTLDPDGGERQVVLKRPRAERDENGVLVRMLVKEALITARLSHPNLLEVFGLEQDGGAIAIVMEHLDGHSLAELAEEHRANDTRAPTAVALAVMRDALLGLESAHETKDSAGRSLRLVHRDLTPHNIFVTRTGRTKVLDFGIAKFAEGGTRTATGLIKGKLGYMAPEQILSEKLDRRTDIFSAGVVLWELLSGRRIGRSSSILEVVRCATDPLPALHEEASWIDEELSDIVACAVAVKREDRFSTAAELREALDDYCVSHALFAAPCDVAAHLEATLGAEARARDERIRRVYPYALRALAGDEPRISSVPTLRMGPARSDAPVVTESHRDQPGPRSGRARPVIGALAAAAAIVVTVAGTWSHLARTAFAAASVKARDHVAKHVVAPRWESRRLTASDETSGIGTEEGDAHGNASAPKNSQGTDRDRRAP